MPTTDEYIEIWRSAQQRVIDLCRETPHEQIFKRVPATPEWTVHDLVAHMTGVDADITEGHGPSNPIDDWTASHVHQRHNHSIDDILDEWTSMQTMVADTIKARPEKTAPDIVGDVSTHEQDLRGALEKPGARDHEGMHLSLMAFFDLFSKRVKDAELPALRVIAGEEEMVAGEGEPAGSVQADPYELHRALTGRRSANQVRTWEWTCEPEPYLSVFSFSGSLRDTDLVE